MRILFLTAQSFHPEGRKASTHFLASGLQQLGHEVFVLTVGVSLARIAMAPHRNKGALSYRSWKRDADGIWKRVLIDLVHRPARSLGYISRILDKIKNSEISDSVLRKVGRVDAVVIASGLAVSYYEFARKRYPSARILYNAADYLPGVGYSGKIIKDEERVLSQADAVRTPSALLANNFPKASNWHLIPHGVDKTVLLEARPSPFPEGSSNAVLVGSTLLDWSALEVIAKAVPDTHIHVFGVASRPSLPSNIVLHGEVAFKELAPFLQHASLALAPYDISPVNAYIAESSLKLRQYRVCGLPIVCPSTLAINGDDIFKYDSSSDSSVAEALRLAFDRGRKPYNGKLPDWKEVAEQVETLLRGEL